MRRAAPWHRARVLRLVLAAAGLAWPHAVAAQQAPAAASPDADGTSRARALFEEATERAHRQDWSEALHDFERSDALRPHAVTRYNIGYCERALGRVTRARRMFAAVLAGDAERGAGELPEDFATAARQYLAELEARVAHVTLTVLPEGAAILVDGRPLERSGSVASAGTREPGPAEPAPASPFEVEIDPGSHTFVASKDGYESAVTTRAFEEGARQTLSIDLPPIKAAAAWQLLAPTRPASARATAPNRLPFAIALGVGAAGALAGGISGVVALVDKGKVADSCQPHVPCPGAGSTYLAHADEAADISTAGFVVAGVGAAAAAALWWFSSRRAAAPATSSSWVPQARPGGAVLLGTF
jgi:hypothetical protein